MNKETEKENKILTGVIWKQLLIFFFPILIGTFFQQMYNTVDAVVVGRFAGKEALSSVGGSAGQLINLVVGFFTGLTAGGTVLISQYYGAKQKLRLDDVGALVVHLRAEKYDAVHHEARENVHLGDVELAFLEDIGIHIV